MSPPTLPEWLFYNCFLPLSPLPLTLLFGWLQDRAADVARNSIRWRRGPRADFDEPYLRAANMVLGASVFAALGFCAGLAATALLLAAGSAPPSGMLAGTALGAVIGALWRDEPDAD